MASIEPILRGTAARHHAHFLAAMARHPGAREIKEAGAPSAAEIARTLDGLAAGFEAFKVKNDERLKQIETRGSADVVTREELEKISGHLDRLSGVKKDLEELQTKLARPGALGGGGPGERLTPEAAEHKSAFEAMLREPEDHGRQAALQEAEKKWRGALPPEERKAVNTLTGAAGGFAVPEMIAARIERELAETAGLRNIVDVVQAGSADFKQLVDVGGQAYGWVGEGDARAETGTAGLAEVAPTFGMIYAYPKASEEALSDMFFDVENWILTSTLEGFERGEDAAIVSGNGTKKPTGFLTGAPTAQKDGVRAFGTLQYVASGAAATLSGGDPLVDLIYALKSGYRANARWLMNKMTVARVRKLKDSEGDYLWRPGLELGQPDRLLGYPVKESEDMPDVAADSLPIAFGDFKAAYLLVPLTGLRITRDEVTTPGYVKWYVRRRLGGKVRKSEAIKLLKIAAT
ncbi:phage major capsid protein [Neomegalonema sp.]|uniref:phage major capsid protein n=1 Tax=Neomegalonema sp. TaxID=2039713 RepID=UPI0026151FA8|nr:phage major capsid protein [Neomegalonema sp.]MDD2870231.1 phage major capsid protein [Neomegalonema sp.]